MEGGKKRLMDIKDWYRRGMDDGVGEDKDLKGESLEDYKRFSADLLRAISSRGESIFRTQYQLIRACPTATSQIINRHKAGPTCPSKCRTTTGST